MAVNLADKIFSCLRGVKAYIPYSSKTSRGDYSREAIVSYIELLEVVPLIFCSIFPLNQKLITSKKLNMGFSSVPNYIP